MSCSPTSTWNQLGDFRPVSSLSPRNKAMASPIQKKKKLSCPVTRNQKWLNGTITVLYLKAAEEISGKWKFDSTWIEFPTKVLQCGRKKTNANIPLPDPNHILWIYIPLISAAWELPSWCLGFWPVILTDEHRATQGEKGGIQKSKCFVTWDPKRNSIEKSNPDQWSQCPADWQ